jgi:type II secretory pathway pseudopilin PulG
MNKESGFVLPVVMVLIALLSTLFLFASKEWGKWKQQDQFRLTMVQASYASESGIAIRQAELEGNPDDYSTKQEKIGEFTVDISVWESLSGTIFIKAVAKGKDGVQQTEAVELEKRSLRILYWLE